MPDERQTRTVAEAAAMLGVAKGTLYEAIASDAAPFKVIRVGDRVLIPRESLERLVTEGEASK